MDVRDSITDAVRSVLADLGVDPLPTIVQLERPGNPEHGDWSTNVALASAKAAGRNPRELGTQLARLHMIEQPFFGWHRDNCIGATPQPNPRQRAIPQRRSSLHFS